MGRAEGILRVLAVRGIEIPEAVRERVVSCDDLEVFDAWLDRSLTASKAEELFEAE
ncbi:hypothetical protein [Streptomyces acidicola]|uniref:hypothetical protein n=1 Tax=Streptomyces acidicola TaxID=2596892 RepID=UPI0034178ED2